MWKTCRYTISLLLLTAGICHGQQDSGQVTYGLRLGVDLSRFVLDYLQPNRRDAEFSADMQFKENWFAVAEGGWNFTSIDNSPKFQYSSSGYFWRLGFDYNLLEHNTIKENNIVYGGLRLGHANFRQSSQSFEIIDNYWGNVKGSIPVHDVGATWIELAAGMKIEALKNFFIGWSVRERILFKATVDPLLTPYVIPGFGNGFSQSAFDVNYSLYYRIPFIKVFIRPKPKKTPPPVKGPGKH